MQNADLHQRIKLRAYLLWEQEGRPEGRAEEHWLRAEAEMAGVNTGRGGVLRGLPAQASTSAGRAREPGAVVGTDVRHAAAPARIIDVPEP